jgi:ssDNA-binding Zn-finger/Zn-ribbon topoisomerase 1
MNSGIEPKKVTTKECPNCGNTQLIHISTQNFKLCSNCFDAEGNPTRIPWFKEEHQPDYI